MFKMNSYDNRLTDRCEVIFEIFVKKTQKSKFALKKISKMTSHFKENFQEIIKTKTDGTKNRDKSRLFLIQIFVV
jgi:hypothetical protein